MYPITVRFGHLQSVSSLHHDRILFCLSLSDPPVGDYIIVLITRG